MHFGRLRSSFIYARDALLQTRSLEIRKPCVAPRSERAMLRPMLGWFGSPSHADQPTGGADLDSAKQYGETEGRIPGLEEEMGADAAESNRTGRFMGQKGNFTERQTARMRTEAEAEYMRLFNLETQRATARQSARSVAYEAKMRPMLTSTPSRQNWIHRPDHWKELDPCAHLHELWHEADRIHAELTAMQGRPPRAQSQSPPLPSSPTQLELELEVQHDFPTAKQRVAQLQKQLESRDRQRS